MIKTLFLTIVYLGSVQLHDSTSQLIGKMQSATHMKVVIVSEQQIDDPNPELNNVNTWMQRYEPVKQYVLANAHIKPNSMVLVYLPFITDTSGNRYNGGLSYVCYPKNGFALAWGGDDQFGNRGGYYTQITAEHELGHLLGAEHDPTEYDYGYSIMNPYLITTQRNMRYSQKSVTEIQHCMKEQYGTNKRRPD